VCVCVCVCVCVYTHTHTHIYIYTHTHTHTLYIHIHIIFVCMYDLSRAPSSPHPPPFIPHFRVNLPLQLYPYASSSSPHILIVVFNSVMPGAHRWKGRHPAWVSFNGLGASICGCTTTTAVPSLLSAGFVAVAEKRSRKQAALTLNCCYLNPHGHRQVGNAEFVAAGRAARSLRPRHPPRHVRVVWWAFMR